jgi:hypothetical protein
MRVFNENWLSSIHSLPQDSDVPLLSTNVAGGNSVRKNLFEIQESLCVLSVLFFHISRSFPDSHVSILFPDTIS